MKNILIKEFGKKPFVTQVKDYEDLESLFKSEMLIRDIALGNSAIKLIFGKNEEGDIVLNNPDFLIKGKVIIGIISNKNVIGLDDYQIRKYKIWLADKIYDKVYKKYSVKVIEKNKNKVFWVLKGYCLTDKNVKNIQKYYQKKLSVNLEDLLIEESNMKLFHSIYFEKHIKILD